MGEYIIKVLIEDNVKEICSWKYEGEFSIYNFPDYSTAVKNGWGLTIKNKREKEFIGIFFDDKLIAYGRIRNDKGKVFIGIGVKPSWCGKGYGKNVMKLLVEECKKRFPSYPITLEVRSFNIRAIKCYINIGFEIKDKYIKNVFNGEDEFYYMEYTLLE